MDLCSKKISGLNYVRAIKDNDSNIGGYLLIDSNNKPIKDVYRYTKYLMFKKGDSLNTIKRKLYDLTFFYDYMSLFVLTPELIDYKKFYDFITEYLLIINPDYKVTDCIERSMLKEVPILDIYKSKNIRIIDKNNTGGIESESIIRIVDNVKCYLEYLFYELNREINLEDIFSISQVIRKNRDGMLSHLSSERIITYSAKGIIKAAKIPIINRNKCKPIEASQIFESNEEDLFFGELYRKETPSYQFLFYLLIITGMRISEALALKIYSLGFNNYSIDFKSIDSDIRLKDDANDVWEIKINIDPNAPSDLQIKSNSPRVVTIVDSTKQFRNLLKQLILYRNLLQKKKGIKHNYLFINRNATRLKYQRTHQKFNEILSRIGLGDRVGKDNLVIHSFRHTFASKWIHNLKIKKLDVELDLLSKMLGHGSSATTRDTYIHFFKEDILEILKKMENSKFQKEY